MLASRLHGERQRPVLVTAGLTLGFAGTLAGLSILLLDACAVKLPLDIATYGACPNADQQSRLADLAKKRESLLAEIDGLQLDLATLPCAASPPLPALDPNLPDIPFPGFPDIDPNLPIPAPIDEDLWTEQDLKAVEGCWGLNSDYVIRDQRTGEPAPQSEWTICLDDKGQGTQTMQSEDGVFCEGPVTAEFDGTGLVIRDQGDVACSGGVIIFERETTCQLDSTGGAECESFQPRTRGRGRVDLQRLPE